MENINHLLKQKIKSAIILLSGFIIPLMIALVPVYILINANVANIRAD